MKEVERKYQQARQLLKAGKVKDAQNIFREIFAKDENYKSICYFLGKCAYLLGRKAEAKHYLRLHLDGRAKHNIGPAFKYLFLLALKIRNYQHAQQYLKKAEQAGLKKASVTKMEKMLTQAQTGPQTLAFTYIKLSKQGDPIAKTSEPGFKDYKFFIHGMPAKMLARFRKLKRMQLTVTYPRSTQIPGYMECKLTDGRTLYQEFLPELPSLYYRSALNDYLEADQYFKFKWKKSKVFSLLLVPGFSREIIATLLEQNDLLGQQETEHLQSSEGLVTLKTEGEILPVAFADNLSDLRLMQEFGFICKKECEGTIHLAAKCQFERQIIRALKANSNSNLPYKQELVNFQPSLEQANFISWLKNNQHQVVSLLGVGGSGKTYTLGRLLNGHEVLALAPTHKARLNLLSHGFMNNDTIQHFLFSLEADPDLTLNGTKVVLIDEISMVTTEMLAQLLTKLGPGYRYLLVGDDKQLPPVSQDLDALSVCGDLMALLKKYGTYYEFKENLRCSQPKTAQLIAAIRSKNTNVVVKEIQKFQSQEREMLNYKYFHPKIDECLLLAHRNLTVGKINQKYYEVLTKDGREHTPFFFKNDYGHGGFFKGAQVVFYQNDDEKQRYGYTNSEFGVVTDLVVKAKDTIVTVKTASGEYELPLYIANRDLFLAYALTVHKAQGSGAKRVYVLEATSDSLLYTAVSRSQGELAFVGLTSEKIVTALNTEVKRKFNLY